MFSSRPCRLSSRARFRASTTPACSEFTGGGRDCSPRFARVVLYRTGCLHADDPARSIGRSQPLPYSIGFLPLGLDQRSELHVNNPCGPPPLFRKASTCPGQDRMVSGSRPVARRGGTTPSLTGSVSGEAEERVPCSCPSTRQSGCGLSVSLCHNGLNRLNSPRIEAPWPVILDGSCNPAPPASRLRLRWSLERGSALSGCKATCRQVSGSFHIPHGILFSFPS